MRGFHVFRAVSPACPCDILAFSAGRFCRVEVTTGYAKADGEIGHSKPFDGAFSKFDILATVHKQEIRYFTNLGQRLTTFDKWLSNRA